MFVTFDVIHIADSVDISQLLIIVIQAGQEEKGHYTYTEYVNTAYALPD